MKVCFPARKNGGKDYTSVDEIMTQVLGEPHGCWLAGSNLLWHGGLHISTVTAPDSVLTAETVDSAVPLQFMAGGGSGCLEAEQGLSDLPVQRTNVAIFQHVCAGKVCLPAGSGER